MVLELCYLHGKEQAGFLPACSKKQRPSSHLHLMPKKVNKCTVSYGTFILSAAFACLLAQLHFFMAMGHFKEKKNLYLLFTLRFWFYSVSQRAQTNTFKPRCLLLGLSLCAVQSYPAPQSLNPHQTIFYTGVSYLSCILHALRQAFSF